MNKKILLLLCLILLFFVALYLGRNQSVNLFKYKTGLAPDFSLKDIEGEMLTFSSLKGHPLLIFFGTTWCPQCRDEMNALKPIYEKYQHRGLRFIYIDINESAERVSRFTTQNAYPGTILLDTDGSVAYDYDVKGVPSIILVNAEGKIVQESRQATGLSFDVMLGNKQ